MIPYFLEYALDAALVRHVGHSSRLLPDLGAAGKDNYYGYGLVNPYKAITGN